jgi:hypothetical protein
VEDVSVDEMGGSNKNGSYERTDWIQEAESYERDYKISGFKNYDKLTD